MSSLALCVGFDEDGGWKWRKGRKMAGEGEKEWNGVDKGGEDRGRGRRTYLIFALCAE